MWASLIAVFGTLAGALVSGRLAHRAARSDRAEGRTEQLRRDRIDSVTALAVAVADHRRAMWELVDAQLTGQPDQRVRDLRDESHRTRSMVTEPAVRVRLLIAAPTVRAAAEAAVRTTYVMRDAASLEALQDQRASALEAHDVFVNSAGTYLTAT